MLSKEHLLIKSEKDDINMKRNYIFAPYVMERTTNDIRIADIMRITHLNIAFAHVKDSIVTVDHLKYLDRVAIYKAINPDLKVLISVGGWGADGFSQAAMTQEGRELFAKTSCEIVKKWGFDGIDIDWEYPCSDQAGIAYDPADKVNFTLLLHELRNTLNGLGESYLLTAAVGGEQYYIDGTEMDKVAQILDFINLMTYDLRGGFSHVTGHHANLGPQTGDENGPSSMRTIEIYHNAGVPYNKMVLGAAFYGRAWSDVQSKLNNGLGQTSSNVGVGGGGFDELKASYINKNGYTRYFDEKAQAPYLFDGSNFITYEDEASIKAKCDYVKGKGLAGIMYWAYGCHDLFEVMNDNI